MPLPDRGRECIECCTVTDGVILTVLDATCLRQNCPADLLYRMCQTGDESRLNVLSSSCPTHFCSAFWIMRLKSVAVETRDLGYDWIWVRVCKPHTQVCSAHCTHVNLGSMLLTNWNFVVARLVDRAGSPPSYLLMLMWLFLIAFHLQP